MFTAILCLCLTGSEAPPLTPPPPPRPLTLEEFAATFKPAPGTYEVLFMHPASHKAVSVTFTLPPGCNAVRAERREVVFDCGSHTVRLRFRLLGKVAVISN